MYVLFSFVSGCMLINQRQKNKNLTGLKIFKLKEKFEPQHMH